MERAPSLLFLAKLCPILRTSPRMTAAVDRRQGHWDDAFKNYERAIELDPLDSVTLEEAGFTYSRLRRFAEAKPYLERAAAANPNDIFVRLVLWSLPYYERGDTSSLQSRLDELLRTNPVDAPRLAAFYVEVALAERNRAAAEQALRLIPAEGSVDTTLNAFWPRDWYVGLVAKSFGDASGAAKAFAAARANAVRNYARTAGLRSGLAYSRVARRRTRP